MKLQPSQCSIEVVTDKTVLSIVTDVASHPEQEEPFFVVDIGDLIFKHKLWKLKLPRVHPFYAVKCNDCPLVLELLASLGVNFDCASKGEIEPVLAMGVDPSRIIYANPCKTRSFIKHAASVGVDLMTFDNEMELHKVKAIYPAARMVLRIRVDDSSAICRLGIKFGCDVEEAPRLLKVAKDLGVEVVGVSFHVGSGCRDVTAYSKAIFSARCIFDTAEKMGFCFNLLDLGGGFPGDKNSYATFDAITTVINDALTEYFPEERGVDIIAEPGRFYVASAFTLCTNVIAKRDVAYDNEEQTVMYYLNDGVYGSFNCLIFDHAEVSPIPIMGNGDREVQRCSLWGPTCDSMDRIMESCYLPAMDVGEWIAFENMGAYTLSAASNFNGFQKPVLKFILPLHTLVYLQQLSSWPQLVQTLADHNMELLETRGQVDFSAQIPTDGIQVLPIITEPLLA